MPAAPTIPAPSAKPAAPAAGFCSVYIFQRKSGSTARCCKSIRREIFCRAEIRGAQAYFVYVKLPEPMARRKSSGEGRSRIARCCRNQKTKQPPVC